ncbi:hypothetical protein DL771_008268 [Monosporascus sp. 5C6A]|nr:hypothetical protein DL771_008268 [Monosporascus sp. 5C6A]
MLCVRFFWDGSDLSLQQRLEGTSPAATANAYERQSIFQRREPLQDCSEFSVGHPIDDPSHSQAMSVAVLTLTATDFARRSDAGEIAQETLHRALRQSPLSGVATFFTAIDPSAFVMCLHDESPNSAGERHMYFLNGHQYPFANRWLDKPARFTMTVNGLSAGIYEHAKLDGMDVRAPHRHPRHALFVHSSIEIDSSASKPYHFREHTWRLSPTVM